MDITYTASQCPSVNYNVYWGSIGNSTNINGAASKTAGRGGHSELKNATIAPQKSRDQPRTGESTASIAVALVRAKQPPPARFGRPSTWWTRLRAWFGRTFGRRRLDS